MPPVEPVSSLSIQTCPCWIPCLSQTSFISCVWELITSYWFICHSCGPGPLAGTANQLLVCQWHCQWKRLVCKVQTTSTTLLNKKALVKAFGSDAILTGVTCKYATAVTCWPSCFVLCTHVRQKCIHARAPIPRHEEQTCSCLYDLSL